MTAAMVLSAGFGTRLRPLTDELAKPLMPVGDRSMIAHIVQALRDGGAGRIVVNTHYRSDDFIRCVEWLGMNINVLHEREILGTAGGIAHAVGVLGPGSIVVWNGDIWASSLDVERLVPAHRASHALALWVVSPRPAGEGTVGLGANGAVVRLRGEVFGTEMNGGDFIGIQVLGEEARSRLPERGCLVADVALPILRAGGQIASFRFDGVWHDVGEPGALLCANLEWLKHRSLGSWVAPDASVAEGVVLERSLVGSGARVRGAGVVRECVVLAGAELAAPAERVIQGKKASMVVTGSVPSVLSPPTTPT